MGKVFLGPSTSCDDVISQVGPTGVGLKPGALPSALEAQRCSDAMTTVRLER